MLALANSCQQLKIIIGVIISAWFYRWDLLPVWKPLCGGSVPLSFCVHHACSSLCNVNEKPHLIIYWNFAQHLQYHWVAIKQFQLTLTCLFLGQNQPVAFNTCCTAQVSWFKTMFPGSDWQSNTEPWSDNSLQKKKLSILSFFALGPTPQKNYLLVCLQIFILSFKIPCTQDI